MPESEQLPHTTPAGEGDAGASALRDQAVIAGQDEMLERVLTCLLAGGHLLIEGVPGLAKTLTIKTAANVLGGTFNRIQFTPDLVPRTSWARGSTADSGSFDTHLGPCVLQLPARGRDQPRRRRCSRRCSR